MPIADESLASQHSANGGHVDRMANEANGYRCVQEGNGDEVCVAPVDEDFRFTTSSSRLFAASGTGNNVQTSNGEVYMQTTATVPVRVGGDDVTCRIVAEQVDDALPTYYFEDFGQARNQLIQALQDNVSAYPIFFFFFCFKRALVILRVFSLRPRHRGFNIQVNVRFRKEDKRFLINLF